MPNVRPVTELLKPRVSPPPASAHQTDRRSRIQRWRDAVAELTAVQAQCVAWLDALPTSLHEGATAEALQAICELDFSDLQAIEPPRGFGRD